MSQALVFAEHHDGALNPATLNAIHAASQMADAVDVLVAGEAVDAIAQALAQAAGVRAVLTAQAGHYANLMAEEIAPLLVREGGGYTHIVAAATSVGKNILPRVAAMLDVAMVSDIIAVEAPNQYKRPIYAGNAIATVESNEKIQVITVRKVAFDAAATTDGSAEIKAVDATDAVGLSSLVKLEETGGDRPDLTSAPVVVSGGRGVGSADDFALIEKLADALGGAVGASRAAVDSGYAPNDWQVGQTGKIVAPALYIAVGISGAIQHLAGMKESKVIVAINKDENAPIFEVADYGLVADLFDAVPELIEKLS